MPATQIYVRSRDEIARKLEEVFATYDGSKVILLFEGSTDIATGDSWNKACREVESLLEPLLNSASEKTVFLMAEVGDEDAWQDVSNYFRSHETYQLTDIPTLLLLTGPETVVKRLNGSACLNKEALNEFFN